MQKLQTGWPPRHKVVALNRGLINSVFLNMPPCIGNIVNFRSIRCPPGHQMSVGTSMCFFEKHWLITRNPYYKKVQC